MKTDLNIKEEKVILSVGQFIHRKGFDLLLKASANLPKEYGVYIVGGEPTKEYLELQEKYNLSNVHFISFKSKEELNKYYLSGDLFVFPTREDIWGLVINEAMASGLPVITTDKCIAGLELIENDENGFIVPVDNVQAMAEKINIVLSSEDILTKMSRNSLKKMKDYTIEKMVQIHVDIFDKRK